jgi:hypothetical protein
MQKIKISTITILALAVISYLIGIIYTNDNAILLAISLFLINLCMFVYLNFQALKIKGLIKKLMIYADIAFCIMIVLSLTPYQWSLFQVLRFSANIFILIFVGLLVAILVQAYKKEKI